MAKDVIDKIDKILVGEGLPPWLEKKDGKVVKKDKKDNDDEKDEKEDEDKKKVDESMVEPSEMGIKPGEYNNLSTGLRRIEFRLQKANTPQKYVDAFEVIQQLITRFPLKSKIIWGLVSSIYNIRFGASSTPFVNDAAPEE